MHIIKKYWLILLLGLFLRILISAFTYHPDARILSWTPRIILHDGQINFYDFAINLNSSDPRYNTYKVEAVDDLPLHHWIRIPFDILTRPLVNLNIEQTYLEDASKLFGDPALWIHLALDKLQLVTL